MKIQKTLTGKYPTYAFYDWEERQRMRTLTAEFNILLQTHPLYNDWRESYIIAWLYAKDHSGMWGYKGNPKWITDLVNQSANNLVSIILDQDKMQVIRTEYFALRNHTRELYHQMNTALEQGILDEHATSQEPHASSPDYQYLRETYEDRYKATKGYLFKFTIF